MYGFDDLTAEFGERSAPTFHVDMLVQKYTQHQSWSVQEWEHYSVNMNRCLNFKHLANRTLSTMLLHQREHF